ncbi:hypothetical protein GQ53DRAFT_877182 [Thozetella sp. PMI_491]|nr:hypothetical protein GQ53DRAFT_877182 [Thozetella sp. PMI_491]
MFADFQPNNYFRPLDDRGPALQVGQWLLTSGAFAFLTTRIYCKVKRHRRIHSDDILLIIAWFFLLASAITNTLEIILFGFGKHANVARPTNLRTLVLTGNLSITFTVVSLSASKTSWALTLSRLTSGWIRGMIWFTIVTINLLFTATAFVYWLGCIPQITHTCLDPRVGMYLSIATTAYSGFMDVVFAVLPWWILRPLEASRSDKISVAVAMSMGIFAATAAFLKCASMPELLSSDFSYVGVTLTFWGFSEMAVTIMAASTPMLWVLVRTSAKKSMIP